MGLHGQSWLSTLSKKIRFTSFNLSNPENASMGHMTDPFLALPLTVVTKPNTNKIKSINELNGKEWEYLKVGRLSPS